MVKLKSQDERKILYFFLFVSFLIRSFAASLIGPGFDEAYYYVYSLNLSGGYFDHPPLVALTAGLGHWITGLHHPLILRLGAILWFTISSVGFYLLARDLYGIQAGFITLLIVHATPYFLVGAGAFVIPDNGLVAAWVWFLFVLNRTRNNKELSFLNFALLGVIFGIALLAKYHAVFLPAAFAIATFYDTKLRRFWTHPGLYLSLVIAALIFLPCILWNYENSWISFAEQFGKSGGEFRIRFDLIGQAIGGQAGYLAPWIFFLIWIVFFKKIKNDRNDSWLYPFFLLPVLAFTLQGLTRGILPHWTMPGYIAGIIITSGYLSGKIEDGKLFLSKTFKWLSGAFVFAFILILLVILQARIALIPMNEKGDPTLDPFGWAQTVEYLEEGELLSDEDVIFVHKWFTGGELTWADKNRHPVVHLGGKPHMFTWWHPPSEYLGRSGYFITQKRYRLKDKDVQSMLIDRFDSVEKLDIPPFKRGKQEVEMVVFRVNVFNKLTAQPYGPDSLK